MKITLQEPDNAPNFCFLIVAEDGREVFLQSDWDYPCTANTFGWSIRNVQRCPECGHISTSVDYHAQQFVCTECEYNAEDYQRDHPGEVYPVKHASCDHDGDGTVPCKQCGLTQADFISAAYDWLRDNIGKEADDPGYFSE